MTVAQQLAGFVTEASWDRVPVSSRRELKIRVLDSLGCAIGALGPFGTQGPLPRLREAVDELGGAPHSTLIGGGRSAPDLAALTNGAAVRYLDFNDTFMSPGESCHPSDNLGAVLAAAEHARAAGTTVLTALAVAYQVQCALSADAPVRARGFDHTTQGAFAVAAGVAHALGLDHDRTTEAICIAGTPSQALRVTRTGRLSHWKGLAYPMAAATATRAVYLARHGITGPPEVFEGTKGFMESVAGEFAIDWHRQGLDAVEQVMIKRYNAEAHGQSAIAAILAMRDEGLRATDVERIDVEAFDACFNIIGGGAEGDKHVVETREEADHSLPYLLAVALLDGQVMPEQYEPDRLTDPVVHALLRRVHVAHDPALTARIPDEMPVRLRVQLASGRVWERDQDDFAGFPSNPMPWDDAADKFRGLAEPHVPVRLVDEVIAAVDELERADTLDPLMGLLAAVPTAWSDRPD